MATRIKDISTSATTLNTDDYFVVDGPSGGTRKLSATDARDSNGNLRDIPGNTQTGAYTLVALDRGKFIRANGNVTVPANVFATGQAVTIFADTASGIAILQGGTSTLRLAGTNTTGNRGLAQYGICTILCIDGAGSAFVISGAGLT